jgi:hypothetical protein
LPTLEPALFKNSIGEPIFPITFESDSAMIIPVIVNAIKKDSPGSFID